MRWGIIHILFLQGECQSPCQGVQLGMFSGFGHSRASNKGEEQIFQRHDIQRMLPPQVLVTRTTSGALELQADRDCQWEK